MNERPISIKHYRDLTSIHPNFVFKEQQLMRTAAVE